MAECKPVTEAELKKRRLDSIHSRMNYVGACVSAIGAEPGNYDLAVVLTHLAACLESMAEDLYK